MKTADIKTQLAAILQAAPEGWERFANATPRPAGRCSVVPVFFLAALGPCWSAQPTGGQCRRAP